MTRLDTGDGRRLLPFGECVGLPPPTGILSLLAGGLLYNKW